MNIMTAFFCILWMDELRSGFRQSKPNKMRPYWQLRASV